VKALVSVGRLLVIIAALPFLLAVVAGFSVAYVLGGGGVAVDE